MTSGYFSAYLCPCSQVGARGKTGRKARTLGPENAWAFYIRPIGAREMGGNRMETRMMGKRRRGRGGLRSSATLLVLQGQTGLCRAEVEAREKWSKGENAKWSVSTSLVLQGYGVREAVVDGSRRDTAPVGAQSRFEYSKKQELAERAFTKFL